MNASGSAKKRIKARIYREYVNITFTYEKKWEQSDDCINDEITCIHLNELPVILKYLCEKVLCDIENEVKNADILNAANAILDAILSQKTYIASSCTLSSVKSDSKQNDTFTAFPDILMSLNDKTCRKAELKTPFVAVDYKITGKLLIFDNEKENLSKIWKSTRTYVVTQQGEGRMKYKKINNRFKLMNPVLQIAVYMIWSVAIAGILLAYPRAVWFEIENNENEDVFNIKVYPLLKMNSFADGMVEIVCILKCASKLEPNKKMFI
ncbi:hypothetical protein RFI_40335 [Reticulomyxa filosa]|uniref:Uncharacterized protein n=1 Tax=Reticulomyxa filosa TaxID=46433 RepID=X6L836_RETFI|nr:hypothetical protein RFI_40335 [Reticulomyxa filosa]|eukprot:ETN97196.1 hypothetical protein RFI_40335 [Reticulomyxa filosa]